MDRPVLFINTCVRKESRTRRLAEKLLLKLDRPYEEIRLDRLTFPSVDEEYLRLYEAGTLTAKQLDEIRLWGIK